MVLPADAGPPLPVPERQRPLLACPEANRLIFEDLEHPIKYVNRAEPTGVPALDRYCAAEEPALSGEETGRLYDLLEERNELMEALQDWSFPLKDRYGLLFSLATEYGVDASAEDHEALVELIDRMELLDERWTRVYDPVKRAMDEGFPCDFVLQGLAEWTGGGPGPEEGSLDAAMVDSEKELVRFLVYLVFRYYIDGYFENSLTGVFRLLLRGFHMMRLLLAALTPEQFCDAETRRDLYHVWSREVEHSPENFRLIKAE